ncbi:hypothetical protein F2Q70_00003830 [Brassica cretica]|uniref:Neprosin PEP catalytic domain-containing protein n=1 Tax=Brassica cretica TaxID=69181 RepID=A0A8S9IWX8_BRACR|nr:hypothetical protein F2Q70_00003830 [Brassica cretica]
MASSSSFSSPTVTSKFIGFLLLLLSLQPDLSLGSDLHYKNQTSFRPKREIQKLRKVEEYLKRINKPSIKTIHSPDGDVIECVPSHLQPAFDHPQLRGQKPLDLPEMPSIAIANETTNEENFNQLWSQSGECCPIGSIPMRRTTKTDVLRARSVRRFGRRLKKPIRRDSSGGGHEHAVVFVNGEQYYGAKASINVWTPRVTDAYEFSLSQIWLISGSFGHDLNTIEAGWQVSPELYGDNYPRFFTYWTGSYKPTIKLQLAQRFPQGPLTMEDNLTSA